MSPDGKTLVFDLLGDIYTLPISGGNARPLLEGRAWDRSPRFSPDGRNLAFISDRTGSENVWVLDLSSHELRRVTEFEGDFLQAATGTPEWLPNGQEISFGLSTPAVMGLSVVSSRGGVPRKLLANWKIPTGMSWASAFSASFTPGGRAAFFSVAMSSDRTMDTETKPWKNILYRADFTSGRFTRLTQRVPGRDEFKPQVSSSGHFLAFARRTSPGDVELRLRDLSTGTEKPLTQLVDADEPKNAGNFLSGDEIPAYAFTPDDKFIVVWYAGTLHKVSTVDGTSQTIPFNVHVIRDVATPLSAHYSIQDGPVRVRAVRWPNTSRDGAIIVFSSVGSIWTVDSKNRVPRRVTASSDFEFMPSLSPDSRSVAYVAFPHTEDEILPLGKLMLARLDTGEVKQLIFDNANYAVPAWSKDGTKLAVVRQSGAHSEFGWVDVAGAIFHAVAAASVNDIHVWDQHISFSEDGRRLLFQRAAPGAQSQSGLVTLRVADLDGREQRELVVAPANHIYGIFPAPDLSKAVVLGWDLEAHLIKLPPSAAPLKITTKGVEGYKVSDIQISEGGALYPTWLNSSSLTFSWGDRIFKYDVGKPRGVLQKEIDLQLPRRGGEAIMVFRHARLITVAGTKGADPVIEDGAIVIRGRRIEAIGTNANVSAPPEATIIDATGLTIMPGLVDSHSHAFIRWPSVIDSIPIGYLEGLPSGLAYGITTSWEAMGSQDDGNTAEIEMIETGRLRGQRWFTAGGILNRAKGRSYQTFDEVRAKISKKLSLGAEQCLKSRREADRTTVQWYVEAARQAGVCLVAHTDTTKELLALAGDGVMVDHPTLPTPVYRDVREFLSLANATWTPNTILANSSTSTSNFAMRSFLDELKSRSDEFQLRKAERYAEEEKTQITMRNFGFSPRPVYMDTAAARSARSAASVHSAGTRVAVSADGGIGLGNHFEMWSLNRGGMSAQEVIRAATMAGAEKLGLNTDVGSLAPGKLADFLVLTGNPLEHIENTLTLRYTVLGGVVYDSDTLVAIAPSRVAESYSMGSR